MAATAKPVRKRVKRAELMNKKTTHNYLPKEMAKMSIKKHHKTLKEAVKTSGMGKKHSKEDLAKANAHMKKHGG